MKHFLAIIMAVLFLSSCEKAFVNDENSSSIQRMMTFSVKGDFSNPIFTRSSVTVTGSQMTDLWILDYVDGKLIQQLHQSSTDTDFGSPTLSVTVGTHHLYFITSRGESPVIDTESHTIVWSSVRDTYYKDYSLIVTTSGKDTRTVTLSRVATKMKIAANDIVPASISSIDITPDNWFFGLDYISGQAASPVANHTISVVVPSSYVGTTGTLFVNLYGISNDTEWKTNVTVTAKDASGTSLGTVTIMDAPFLRNRSTDYSGNLFSSKGAMAVNIDDEWTSSVTGEW